MTNLEELTTTTDIPTEVLQGYAVSPNRISVLGGGLVNCTYLVEDEDRQIIIQRLGSAIQPESIDDTDVYTLHLEQDGWDSPRIQSTVEGNKYFEDNSGNIWRGQRYIESDDSAPSEFDNSTLESMGTLLARWHRTMLWLDYTPKHGIQQFHNTAFYAQKLYGLIEKLPSDESAQLASTILESYEQLPPMPKSPSQLIHGDPKIDNILFRNGKPRTLIDLDTVMHGPIWIDIGDMLRSVLKRDISAGAEIDPGKIESTVIGYFNAARPGISLSETVDKSTIATKHIALELAMRYLNDISDDCYFSWDELKFTSRHDNHLERANLQFELFKNLKVKGE